MTDTDTMTTKRGVLLALILAVVLAVQYKGTPRMTQAVNPPVERVQSTDHPVEPVDQPVEQAQPVEQDVTARRQEIETWYTDTLVRLKAWAEKRQKELDGEEKAAWARCQQQMQNTQSRMRTTGRSQGNAYISPNGYVTGTGYSQADGQLIHQVVGDPAGEYYKILRRIKNSRAAVEGEFVKLKNERGKRLADLETYVYRITHYAKQDAQRRTQGGPGLLYGIFASGSGYAAMIDGVTVQEGSLINGYRVRRITSENVECDKDGQVFTLSLQ